MEFGDSLIYLYKKRNMKGGKQYYLALETVCLPLAPMAPHISSELWRGVRRGKREWV